MTPFGFDDRQQIVPEDDLERRIAEDIIPIKAQDQDYETSTAMIEGSSELTGGVVKYLASLAHVTGREVGGAIWKGVKYAVKVPLYAIGGGLPRGAQLYLEDKLGKDYYDAESGTAFNGNVAAPLMYGPISAGIASLLTENVGDVVVAGVFGTVVGGLCAALGRASRLDSTRFRGHPDGKDVVGEPILSTLYFPFYLMGKGLGKLSSKARALHVEARELAGYEPEAQKVPLDQHGGKGGGDA